MKSFCYSLVFSLLCISCGPQHYLGVSRAVVDKTTLASTFARSPDPEQSRPPKGEKLYVSWLLPPSLKPKDLHITLSVIYKDFTEETLEYPVSNLIGAVSFPLINEKFNEKQGFFAYQALLLDKDNHILDKWEHQLWTEIIH